MNPNEASKELSKNWKEKAEVFNSLFKVPVVGSAFVLADNPAVLYQNPNVSCEVSNVKHAKQIKKKIEEEAKNWRSLGIIPPWEG